MDILYVLGRHSKWDNNELRLSLRSIEKFGKNVGRVFLVGHDPMFLSNQVTYIPYKDKYKKIFKQKNILEAICYAVEHSDIGEEFLLSSDDHIYLKATDFNNYPFFCKGMLPTDVKHSLYRKTLYDTRNILIKNGLPFYNFSQHGNTHLFRSAIENAKNLIDLASKTRFGCEPTCLLLNAFYAENAFHITKRSDLKITSNDDLDYMLAKTMDREVVSFDDYIHESIKDYLFKLFSQKSKYEI